MITTIKRGTVFLTLLLVFASTSALAEDATDAQILHLLNRISFGPAPGDIDAVRKTGLGVYIEQQLNPAQLPQSPALNNRLAQLPTLNVSMDDLLREYQADLDGADKGSIAAKEEKKEAKHQEMTIVRELGEAKILRAVLSPAQLQEVMTDFWFNHFNVYAKKNLDRVFISSYERDAIRPYVLGHFRDLLEATARHPAMLIYLDNWENTDPNSPIAQRMAMRMNGKKKQIGINENYAREIMELHTLGVNGGYTQTDVTTLAHILTGWGLERRGGDDGKASFFFDPQRHDFSNQVFLGYNIPGGGAPEIEQVLDLLARHPSTAQHISYELAQYFVTDDPPPALVSRMTQTFQSSDGDIAAVLRTMFQSQEFWDPKYTNAKFKPPFRYVASTLRASGLVPEGDTKRLQGAIDQMGEPLYECLTPNGYANTNDQWLNSDAVLKRIAFAKTLAQFTAPAAPQTIEAALGANSWSANTLATVQKAEPALQPALLLGSPEFVYY